MQISKTRSKDSRVRGIRVQGLGNKRRQESEAKRQGFPQTLQHRKVETAGRGTVRLEKFGISFLQHVTTKKDPETILNQYRTRFRMTIGRMNFPFQRCF